MKHKLDSPVTWTEETYEYCREIARKAIVNPYSGLRENPDRWMYYFANINKCPEGEGTGLKLKKPRENML